MSSDANVIATRYVSAFFDLVAENNEHDNVKKDLLALKSLLAKSAELKKFLVNPVISRNQAEKAMTAVLEAIKASALTKQFFSLLASQRRLAVTEIAIEKYLARLAVTRGELPVHVISASALGKEQIKLLTSVLADATKKKIDLKLSENSELIGGMQIRIGSKMFDTSISGKLARLKLALSRRAA